MLGTLERYLDVSIDCLRILLSPDYPGLDASTIGRESFPNQSTTSCAVCVVRWVERLDCESSKISL